jgi:hypothetical protein
MQNIARTTMDAAPTRLNNPAARQFARLDAISARQNEDFRNLYPNGASWTTIKIFLNGVVSDLPVEIASLRVALGLPHTDILLMPQGEAQIDRTTDLPGNIQNILDNDHAPQNDLANQA